MLSLIVRHYFVSSALTLVCSKLTHPNVLQFMGVFTDKDGEKYIVTEVFHFFDGFINFASLCRKEI